MDRLVAESQIIRQMSRYALAQDTLDPPLLTSLCCTTGKIVMDVSRHLPDHPVQYLTPAELAKMTPQVIGGFTATQHFLGNYFFRWPADGGDGNSGVERVTVTSSVIAYHCIQAEEGGQVESVTMRAYWYSDVEKEADGQRRVRGFQVERLVPLDNPGLYVKARVRVAAGLGRKAKG